MKYQQGDVIINVIDTIPTTATAVQSNVLAEGEATGHAHRVTEGEYQMLRDGERIFLRILSGDATVTHEEHHAVTLPAGDYEVRRVLEYDHFAEEAKIVVD